MGKIAGGAAAGAVGGGGGMLAIFELANFKELFNVNTAPIGMLYALAIFCCLALFSIFAYAHAVQSSSAAAQKVQLIATSTFTVVVVAAVVVIAVLLILRPSSLLKATFSDYKTVAGFPIDAGDESGRGAVLSPGLSDGAPLPFDDNGIRTIAMEGDKNIMIDVKGLTDLETAFNKIKKRRDGLLQQRNALALYCNGQVSAGNLSQECRSILGSIAGDANQGGAGE